MQCSGHPIAGHHRACLSDTSSVEALVVFQSLSNLNTEIAPPSQECLANGHEIYDVFGTFASLGRR